MGKKYDKKSRSGAKLDGYRGALLKMLPVVLMAGLVPLIVKQYKYETGLAQYSWFSMAEVDYEFFLAPKAVVLMILAFVMAGCVAVRLWKERKELAFAKVMIPLFAYGLLCFISSCASVNPSFSFFGGYEQFESFWVLLSYVLVVYYVLIYAQTELELQVVSDSVCACATLVGLIGAFQGIGLDLLATKFFMGMVLSDSSGELSVRMGENQAYATLYNPNYLGVFGSFVLPFLVMLLLFEKNKWRRIWHGVNFVLVALAMLSSRSRAGLIAVGIVACLAVVFAVYKVIKWWYLVIPAINFAVVLLLLVNAYNDNIIFDRLSNIFAADETEVTEYMTEDGTVIRESGMTELYTVKEGVVLRYNETLAVVSLKQVGENGYGMYAIGEDGEQMELTPDDNGLKYTFGHPALADVEVGPKYIGQELGLYIKAGTTWYFLPAGENETYRYIRKNTDGTLARETGMIMAESIGFENRQKMFSGRGYIWSRTIPLLKDRIFIGSGPDTFLLEFPQEDYLMRQKMGFDDSKVMTKPHSMYLQIAVQTGVLSLVCLLVFYAWYAIQSCRLYAFRKLNTQTEAFGIAAFIGSIGYMISGISNDSMVVTAPVFWGMIGLGVAANFATAKARKAVPTE